jgi:hypothetical protein
MTRGVGQGLLLLKSAMIFPYTLLTQTKFSDFATFVISLAAMEKVVRFILISQ